MAAALLAVSLLVVQPAPTKVGVFDIGVVGLAPELKQTAIDSIAAALGSIDGFDVVTRTELDAMLGAERLKETLGCDDATCLAEIGSAAGVQKVIAGSVSKIEAAVTVNLQLVNTQYASVENRVNVPWEGATAKLADVLGAAVEILVLPAKDRKAGTLVLTGASAGAAIVVDGKAQGIGVTEVANLAVGAHTLSVQAEGYEPFVEHFVVRSGGRTQVVVQMVAKAESPFYTRWWFWTVVGAGVVGGTAAALVLTQGNPTGRVDIFARPPL